MIHDFFLQKKLIISFVSVLLSGKVERFSVSCMQDLLYVTASLADSWPLLSGAVGKTLESVGKARRPDNLSLFQRSDRAPDGR